MKGLEALKIVEKDCEDLEQVPYGEFALIEKSLNALEIIKEKYVHIPQLLCAFENQLEEENPLEVYYNGQVGINVPMPLTEEEFDLLKEVLE